MFGKTKFKNKYNLINSMQISRGSQSNNSITESIELNRTQSNAIERSSNTNRTPIERQKRCKNSIDSIDFSVRLGSITIRLPFDSYIFHNLSLNSLKSFTSTLSWRSYNIVFITLHKNYLYVLPRIKRSTWFQYYYIFIGVMRLNVPRVFILRGDVHTQRCHG